MHQSLSRRLLGAVAALTTLASGGVALAATGSAQAASAPVVRTVELAYGDGPVTQTSWDEPIALSFVGQKGDQVSVVSSLKPDYCDTGEDVTLTGPDGEVRQPESMFFRLPAAGRYTFSYRQDCWDSTNDEHNPTLRHSADVQLVKLRVVDAEPGDRVKIPFRTGYVAAIRITPRAGERPVVIPDREWDDVITPYAQRTPVAGTGYPIQDWGGPRGEVVLKNGQRVPGFDVSHSRVHVAKPLVFYRIDAGVTLRLRHLH